METKQRKQVSFFFNKKRSKASWYQPSMGCDGTTREEIEKEVREYCTRNGFTLLFIEKIA